MFPGHAAAWLAMPLVASGWTLETGDQQTWDRQMTDASCSGFMPLWPFWPFWPF
jgi:hypothetical protein